LHTTRSSSCAPTAPAGSPAVLDDEIVLVADVEAEVEAAVDAGGDAAVAGRHDDVEVEVVKRRPTS